MATFKIDEKTYVTHSKRLAEKGYNNAQNIDPEVRKIKIAESKNKGSVVVKLYNTVADKCEIDREIRGLKLTKRFIESFDINGTTYIVMEHIQGDNLRVILEEIKNKTYKPKLGRTLQSEMLLKFIRMTVALLACHGLGLVHRDIKPDNFIENPEDGKITLFDFEKSVNLKELQDDTGHGATFFAAPETEKNINDQKSDIFSLGLTFYYMLGLIEIDGYCFFKKLEKFNSEKLSHKLIMFSLLDIMGKDAEKILQIIAKMLNKEPDSRISLVELGESFLQLIQKDCPDEYQFYVDYFNQCKVNQTIAVSTISEVKTIEEQSSIVQAEEQLDSPQVKKITLTSDSSDDEDIATCVEVSGSNEQTFTFVAENDEIFAEQWAGSSKEKSIILPEPTEPKVECPLTNSNKKDYQIKILFFNLINGFFNKFSGKKTKQGELDSKPVIKKDLSAEAKKLPGLTRF